MTELKAKAYDILAQINFLQQELSKVNEEIANKLNEVKNDEHGNNA